MLVFCHGIRRQEMMNIHLLLVYPRNYISCINEIFIQDSHQMPHDEGVKKPNVHNFRLTVIICLWMADLIWSHKNQMTADFSRQVFSLSWQILVISRSDWFTVSQVNFFFFFLKEEIKTIGKGRVLFALMNVDICCNKKWAKVCVEAQNQWSQFLFCVTNVTWWC